MLTVHHLERSRSHRLIWLVEELGLPYRLETHARDPRTGLAPASLKALHPLGKAPLLVEEDGRVLAESGAIAETLAARPGLPPLRPPPDSTAGRRCSFWMHFAEGSMMPLPIVHLLFTRLARPPVPWLLRGLMRRVGERVRRGWLGPQLDAQFDLMEAELADGPWLAGAAFSLADLMMDFPVEAALRVRPQALAARPRLAAWRAAVQARPAHREAVARGGPVLGRLPGVD